MTRKNIFILLAICVSGFFAHAQQISPTPGYQNYGKVDIADLEMKDCDFEKGANAEVLFDREYIQGEITRHKRVKIFTQAGVFQGSVRIPYYSFNGRSQISEFKAETINLIDGKIVITPVDKKQTYVEKINSYISAFVFAFPNVKPGSIIEYQYSTIDGYNWYFQSDIPTRYSEVTTSFTSLTPIRYVPHVTQDFFKNEGQPYDLVQDKVLINIHSLPDEPYMGGRNDNLERMEYIGFDPRADSWQQVGRLLSRYDAFGGQFGRSLTDEKGIIDQAKMLKSKDEKIAFIFKQVETKMKWNGVYNFATTDGTVRAWDKKVGNSAEINLILFRLLKKSGIMAYPMAISTKENGKLNPFNVNPYIMNSTVVYVPVDTTDAENPKYYVLDATNKFNLFNEIPKDELNIFGLIVNTNDNDFKTIFIKNRNMEIQSVTINADIKSGGQMEGVAQVIASGYNKQDNIAKYKTNGESKFINYLTGNNNSIKVTSLEMEDMDVDTLPVTEKIKFTYDLPGADDNYIYFNPNLFINPASNPLLSDKRYSDVDFGYQSKVLISGTFKIPAGYKIDALPKTMVVIMPDTSITFRRTLNQTDDGIVLRYSISYDKILYAVQDYPYLYAFYKKLYELLNEPIVLKKS